MLFQSTHPVRDVTHSLQCLKDAGVISIHTSREGCDDCWGLALELFRRFQSTHPVRDVTTGYSYGAVYIIISIHTSREGCD